MHTYIQRQNQQVNRRHINITYLLMAPEPAPGSQNNVLLRHLFLKKTYTFPSFFDLQKIFAKKNTIITK